MEQELNCSSGPCIIGTLFLALPDKIKLSTDNNWSTNTSLQRSCTVIRTKNTATMHNALQHAPSKPHKYFLVGEDEGQSYNKLTMLMMQ